MKKSSESSPKAAWYGAGLAFACARCGRCCVTHDEYAFVFLNREDLAAAANHLGVSPESFQSQYCVEFEGAVVFRFDQPECPMLKGDECLIYPVRPVQCQTWPFWPENLGAEKAWQKKVVDFCPGASATTQVPDEEVRQRSKAMRRARGH